MSRFALALLITVALPMGVAQAAQREIPIQQGWVGVDKAEKAIAYAEKHGLPVAILSAPKSVNVTSCPKCAGGKVYRGAAGLQMAVSRSVPKAVKIVVYYGEQLPLADELAGKVTQRGLVANAYIADMGGNVLAHASNVTAATDRDKSFRLAASIASWQTKVARELKSIDRMIEAGRYNSAIKTAANIAKKDSEVTALTTGTEQDKDAEVAGKFYPTIAADTLTKSEAHAADRLAEAKSLIASGDNTQALTILRALSANGSDLSIIDTVRDLLKAQTAQAKAG